MATERTRYYSTRPRRVPPEFCNDELLESCSVLAALLLYRLISQADDQGRLPGAPKYVKAVCFAMRAEVSERKVADALDELVRAGFLIRYDAEHRTFLQIDRWFDLQGKWGQRRTYPSRYPAPPGWTADYINASTQDEEVRAPVAHDARDVRPPSPSSSSSSSTSSSPGLGKPPAYAGGMDRVGDLIEKAKKGQLTQEDAFRLGTSLADETPARGTAR